MPKIPELVKADSNLEKVKATLQGDYARLEVITAEMERIHDHIDQMLAGPTRLVEKAEAKQDLTLTKWVGEQERYSRYQLRQHGLSNITWGLRAWLRPMMWDAEGKNKGGWQWTLDIRGAPGANGTGRLLVRELLEEAGDKTPEEAITLALAMGVADRALVAAGFFLSDESNEAA